MSLKALTNLCGKAPFSIRQGSITVGFDTKPRLCGPGTVVDFGDASRGASRPASDRDGCLPRFYQIRQGIEHYTRRMILTSGPSLLGLAAMAAYFLAFLMQGREPQQEPASAQESPRARRLHVIFGVAWLLQGGALLLALGAQPPRFGFAPALSMTLWLVLAVHVFESRVYAQPGVWRTLAALCCVASGLMLFFPGEPRPQVNSPWLPLHWALGIASYGLFGAAVLHGVLVSRMERNMRRARRGGAPVPHGGVPLLKLERLTFSFVWAGFVLLTATLIAGFFFAEQFYTHVGEDMRWDHKTVFSLVSWLIFAGLLVGRSVFGWRGRRALRWLYAGAAVLLLAYVGSRFVLEVVLHRGIY